MSSDPKQKLSLDWMYDGPSSSINQEDYLTGKKVDKQFDRLHSEFQEAPSKLESVIQNKTLSNQGNDTGASARASSSLLDLETIKKEDPLVAIKVREDQMRREMFENPVKMKKLQKIVVKSMEKKMKKFMEKQRRRHSRSSSEESDGSSDRRRRRKSRSTQKDEYRRSKERVQCSDRNRGRHESKRSIPSPARGNQRRESESVAHPRRRHDSTSSSASSHSKRGDRGYGLIYFKERTEGRDHRPVSRPSPPRNPAVQQPAKKQAWKPLSEEEMERRRREMVENAKWRDEHRKKNLKRYAKEEEDEAKRATKQKGEAVDFIRNMVASATDKSSVEGRVKSKIQRLQRSDASMDANFAKR